jgi:hypothetical protein
MKFILKGCTGFMWGGSEVLSQCHRNPTITSVVALSRRKLTDSISDNPKLKVVVIKDFNSYPENVMKELVVVIACLWQVFPSSSAFRTTLARVHAADTVSGVWDLRQ